MRCDRLRWCSQGPGGSPTAKWGGAIRHQRCSGGDSVVVVVVMVVVLL
jgi:hypothetical protein